MTGRHRPDAEAPRVCWRIGPAPTRATTLNERPRHADDIRAMDSPLHVPISAAGMLVAACAVIAGGPLFATGLAALRGRRAARELSRSELNPGSHGPALVRGRVQLASPLFAPLSQRACAGFVLEVAAAGAAVSGRIEDRRSFRLVADGCDAHVAAEEGQWSPAETDSREIASGEVLPTRLEQLIDSVPEARWLRSRGAMRIVERALLPTAEVWVAGVVRRARPAEAAVERVLAATGTDDATAVLIEAAGHAEPELWIEAGEALPLIVSDSLPEQGAWSPPAWQVGLAVVGPLVSLVGMLYLAQALDGRVGGRL